MRIETDKKLFTRDEFARMYDAGILDQDERWELLDGEILKMSNPGRKHIVGSFRANTLLSEALGRRAIVSVQNPLVLDDYNEPKPDVVLFKPRDDFYASEEVEVSYEHALLVIEISDSTLAKDRKRKLPHYAERGVVEFWIEDLRHRLLLVYRNPSGDGYDTCLTLHPGDVVSPIAFPDVKFKVEDLLG